MTFLFGDSTPAPFTTNILDDLRDATALSAAVAEADQRIGTAAARTQALVAETDAEAKRLEQLVRAMLAAASTADKGAAGSPTAALATELAATIADRHRARDAEVRAKLGEAIREVEADVARARTQYRRALEAYLLVREPPEATRVLTVTLVDRGKDDDTYEAVLSGSSDVGLEWSVEVSIPEAGPWSKAMRIEHVHGGLTIQAPQNTGLIKKEVKVRRHKLDRHLVTKVVDDGATVHVELRTELGEKVGFDFSVVLEERLVTGTRVGAEGDPAVGPFAVAPDDKDALLALASKLHAAVWTWPRKRLASASFDGAPFDGQDVEAERQLVQLVPRLVALLAPLAAEIAARSRGEDELILRRSLTDGRREEIFLSKASLREMLAPLDGEHRALFAPLALEGVEAGPTLEVGYAELPSDAPEEAEEAEEPAPPSSRNDALVTTLKEIRAMGQGGLHGEAYRQYATLFGSPAFAACRPADQRRALELMIRGRAPTAVSEEMRAAHAAALPALQALVIQERDPGDYEMLGIAYAVVDQPEKATEVFKKALDIERTRNPASDLCGNLMRRVSQL